MHSAVQIPDGSALTSIRSLVAQRQEHAVQSIRQVVKIESPSGDLDGSRAVNQLLEDALRTIPSVSHSERIASPDCGEHLLVRAFSAKNNNEQSTLLLGHTDTVHPRGTVNVRLEQDRLYGPGIFDMKASCVVAIEALHA